MPAASRGVNTSDQPIERLLEVAYARLSHLNFYAPQSDGSYHTVETGTTAPFESRGYAHRHFVFNVPLPPLAEQTLYLRVASTTAFAEAAHCALGSLFQRVTFAVWESLSRNASRVRPWALSP